MYRTANDTGEIEELGVNESVVIDMHEEVVEMMETVTQGSTINITGTVMPYCSCKGACKTSRCKCRASKFGCHSSQCRCNSMKCKNQMQEVII